MGEWGRETEMEEWAPFGTVGLVPNEFVGWCGDLCALRFVQKSNDKSMVNNTVNNRLQGVAMSSRAIVCFKCVLLYQ